MHWMTPSWHWCFILEACSLIVASLMITLVEHRGRKAIFESGEAEDAQRASTSDGRLSDIPLQLQSTATWPTVVGKARAKLMLRPPMKIQASV